MFAERDLVSDLSKKIELLQQSQSVAKIGSWEYLIGKDTTYWTDEMFRMLELPISADNHIQIAEVESYIYPPDRRLVMDKAQSLAERKLLEYDFRFTTSTGSQIWVHTWCQGFFNERNELYKVRGTCQNISAFRKLEDELERRNDMLQQAEETASLGSWKYNFSTGKGYFSDNFYKLFGHTSGSFETHFEQIVRQLPASDQSKVLSTYQETIADLKERSVDFQAKLPDGSTCYFTSSGKIAFNKHNERIIVGTVQEITYEHLMQEQLKEQNHFVQKLVDSSVNCVLVLDKNLRYILWNKRCEDLYGYKREDVIGRTIAEAFKDHDVAWFENAVHRTLTGEEVVLDEVSSKVTGKYYQMNLIPLRDSKDEVVNVFVLVHDISDLKELNNELSRQKEFAESIIDNSIDCIFVFDKEKRIIEWNRQCETFYNKPRAEALGKTLKELFPVADFAVTEQRMEKVLAGERIHVPAEPSNVIDCYYESYIVPIHDGHGRIVQGLAILHDVSDIMKTNQRAKEVNRLLEKKNKVLHEQTSFLQTLLDTSPDLIGAYDKNLRLITFNKACEEKYGIARDTASGKDVFELFPGIKNTLQLERLRQVLAGEQVPDYEFSSVLDGSSYVAFVAPLRDEKGEIFAALTIAHDITELRETMLEKDRLNEELSFTNSELNRINSELASFSYVASHDLQEPLRKIQAFASLIMVKDLPNISEAGQDYFNRIKSSANRMQQMIDGLLSFSRTNTAAKVFETTDLQQLVKKVLLKLRPEIEQKRATIETEPLPEARVIPHQFEQLIEHLLSNALKFQQADNTPAISIHSSKTSGEDIQGEVAERNKDYYHISIKDNGVGFAPEDADKIFQMFHRLHGKSEFAGTGIGLAICRRIAQNHSGIITAESHHGKGAIFHVYIPVVGPAN